MTNRRIQLLLAAVTVAALAPFLNKAFDIDDPLFLWMAQQIKHHPFDPYGAIVQWSSVPQPLWISMQNPPLSSYYMAAVGALFSFREIPMHLAFLLPAVATVFGTFALAQRLCRRPATAACLTLFSPVFLVSATHVMCDVLLLAFWVWAIHCWIAGLERNERRSFAFAALLISGATLTKYFGISLVPLLLLYTLVRERRARAELVWLALPVVVAIAFELLTKVKYGHALFSSAMLYLRDVAVEVRIPPQTKLMTGLSFIGGCMIGALFFASARNAKAIGVAVISFLLAAALFWICVPLAADVGSPLGLRLQGSLFATVGLCILALALWDFWKSRTADSLLLLLWVFGTFLFATFLNWSITARTVLPMTPAVSILVLRWWERAEEARAPTSFPIWRITALAILSLLIASADSWRADASRSAAREFRKQFGPMKTRVWFQSHWGFQFYMQKGKAKPLAATSYVRPGDLIAIPSDNADPFPLPRPAVTVAEISRPTLPLLTTFAPGTGAGFYSSVRGPVPWVIARTAPERFEMLKFP
ncbi:MAG: glycosyltransferase family 39 protein [Chthoniobacterales bacterium]